MRGKALVAALAVTASLGMALAGCSGNAGGAAQGSGNGATASTKVLNIGNFADVTNWDPSKADIGFDGPYLSAVYDGLVAINGQGQPQPDLAKSWTVSPDGLTYTFHLRSGVKFSDGEPFDAQAAVKSLEYLKNGPTAREAYVNVKDFKAEGPDTVVVDMTKRDDTMLYLMGLGRSWMMAPKAIAAGTLSKTPVGSGPYTLDPSSVPGSVYKFDKVKDFWDAKAFPYTDLTIRPIADATARDNAMMSGQINVNYGDQTALKQAKEKGWNVSAKPSMWAGLLFTDHAGAQPNPFSKLKVREAMNYAFNGAAILKSLGSGDGVATNQVFPAGLPGNIPALNNAFPTSVAKAKQLLSEAGYPHGFSLHMPMSQAFQLWQPVVDQVFKQLGITVTWDNMQYTDYQAKAPTYPVFIAVVSMDSNDVATIQRQISQPQWYNPTPQVEKFPELNALVNAALSAPQGPAQQTAIKAVNTWVVKNAWFDVWYQAKNNYISTKDITVTPVVGMMFPGLRQIQPTQG